MLRNEFLRVVRIFNRVLERVLLSTLDHDIGLRRWILLADAFLLSLEPASHRNSIGLQTVKRRVEIELYRA